MLLDTAQLSQQDMYKLLIASVIPRPVAWAGTRSRNGVNNLAPFSFYNCFSSNPPIVGFSTLPRKPSRRRGTTGRRVRDPLRRTICPAKRILETSGLRKAWRPIAPIFC